MWCETELFEVFAIQMQSNGLLEVANGLVDGFALSNNVDLFAFGNVPIIAFANESLDGMLKLSHAFSSLDRKFRSTLFY